VGLEVQALAGPGAHRRLEDLEARAAPLLGAVHGEVGVPEEVLGPILAVVAQGDTDAGADEDLVAAEVDGLTDVVDHAPGHARRAGFVLHLLEEDGELVTAHAGNCVLAANRGLETPG